MIDSKIQEILNRLSGENKPVWVAAILKMDELLDKWSFVISAPWVNEQNTEHEFQSLLTLFKENLSREELLSIARFIFATKEEHLVQELLNRQPNSKIENETVNGNFVHYGIILESNPDLDWQPTGLFNAASAGAADL